MYAQNSPLPERVKTITIGIMRINKNGDGYEYWEDLPEEYQDRIVQAVKAHYAPEWVVVTLAMGLYRPYDLGIHISIFDTDSKNPYGSKEKLAVPPELDRAIRGLLPGWEK